MNHPLLRGYTFNCFDNISTTVDKEKETIRVIRSQDYINITGSDENYTLSFEEYITNQIWEEYSELISKIDESYWHQKKEEFYDFLEKVKLEVNFILTKADQYYWDYCSEENFSESLSFEGIINHTNTVLEKVLEHLENKYNLKAGEDIKTETTKINNSKKQWLTLIRQAKIEELFNELFELEKINENTDIIILSGRWNNLRQDVSKGILDRDKYDIEFSKITKSLIEFVKNLE